MIRATIYRFLAVLVSVLVAGAAVQAQCPAGWLLGEPLPWPVGGGASVSLTSWDPDGPGPSPTLVVAGGQHLLRTGSTSVGVVVTDGEGIRQLGQNLAGGITYVVQAFADGRLYAGGAFTHAADVVVNGIVRWDGYRWKPMGSGLGSDVRAIADLPDGRLLVGGGFTVAAGAPADYLAVWDGSTWSQFGPALNGRVWAIEVISGSDFVVAGEFTGPNGVSRIARWNGSSWTSLGAGLNNAIRDMVRLANGDIVACGDFTNTGGLNRIARWNGSVWFPFGTGMNNRVWEVAVGPAGELYAAGDFTTAGGVSINRIARWDGLAWRALGPGWTSTVNAIAFHPNGRLYVGGNVQTTVPGQPPAQGLSQWNEAEGLWYPVGRGFNAAVNAIAAGPGDSLLVGGEFRAAGGHVANRVVYFDGQQWRRLGDGVNGNVLAAAIGPNGRFAIGGTFTQAGGSSALNIAEWDGTNWHPLGAGLTGTSAEVRALTYLPNGDLVAGGTFDFSGSAVLLGLGRWDGVQWHPMFPDPVNQGGFVNALFVLPSGELLAAGGLNIPSGTGTVFSGLAKWDSTGWLHMGLTTSFINAITMSTDGKIVVGGDFTGRVQQLNGTTWATLGAGLAGGKVSALANWQGQIIAGGQFTSSGGQSMAGMARWDAASWKPMNGAFGSISQVNALASVSDGTLAVGGRFTVVAGTLSAYLARYSQSASPPAFTSEPTNVAPCIDDTIQFAAGTASTTPATIDWQVEDTGVPDGWRTLSTGPLLCGGTQIAWANLLTIGTNHTLTLGLSAGVRSASNGCFPLRFRSVVTNGCGQTTTQPAVLMFCTADVDCSGATDVVDLFTFLGRWFDQIGGALPPSIADRADIDGNGQVSVDDLLRFIEAWYRENGECSI